MMTRLCLIVCLLCVTSCNKAADPATKDGAPPVTAKDGGKPVPPADKLESITVGNLKLQKFGNIYMSAQPSEEDFAKLHEMGIKTVINLRAEGENKAFDEAKTLETLGIESANYHNPGFNSAGTLLDPIFRRVRDLLTNKNNAPVLMHCASGNRVGAVWMAHRILDDGVPYEQALEEAKAIGMKPQAFEARVKEYVESKPE